jgi:hypothetical protein
MQRVQHCFDFFLQELVGGRWNKMRRVFILVIVLMAILVVAPGIAYAPATRTEIEGTFSMTATWPGEIKVTKNGIMIQRGAEASGPVTSSDTRLTGVLQIELCVIFNLNTGKGNGFGSSTFSNAYGTFEGRFTVKDTDYILFEGKVEGHGTGAYEGLLLKFEMTGTDLYRDADPATNGIDATFTGYILSPHGS